MFGSWQGLGSGVGQEVAHKLSKPTSCTWMGMLMACRKYHMMPAVKMMPCGRHRKDSFSGLCSESRILSSSTTAVTLLWTVTECSAPERSPSLRVADPAWAEQAMEGARVPNRS